MIDSLISYLKKSGAQYNNESISDIRDSLQAVISWVDNQIIDQFIPHSHEPSSSINEYESVIGLEKLSSLERSLLQKKLKAEESNVVIEEPDSDGRSSSCSDSGVDAENLTPTRKNDPNNSFTSSNGSNSGDDTLTDLLQQLQLR